MKDRQKEQAGRTDRKDRQEGHAEKDRQEV
jgi:hypothetical protein